MNFRRMFLTQADKDALDANDTALAMTGKPLIEVTFSMQQQFAALYADILTPQTCDDPDCGTPGCDNH